MTALLFRIFAIAALLAAPLGVAAPAAAMTMSVSMSVSDAHCADQDGPANNAPMSDACDDCAATCSVVGAAIAPMGNSAGRENVAASALPQWATAATNHEADRPPFEPPPPRTA